MAVNFLHKRSNTASKRPTAAQLDIGELSLNYDGDTAGVFFEDSAGNVRKVGPAEVGATAPNSSPAGSSGNSLGELWFDTSVNNLKVWTGSSFANAMAALAVSIVTSDTAPASPSDGDLWYNSSVGRLFVYYQDANTSQWVDASPAVPGVTTPGGSTTQVQYNDSGTMAGTSLLTITSSVNVAADILPTTDNTRNLGSATYRFANVYTGDLHLKNDRGDWTIIEEEDCLTMRNNKTGRVYDIMMTERGTK